MRKCLKLVKPNDVMALNALMDEGKAPSHELLGRCFPDAVDLFGKFMGANPMSNRLWPIEIVREFWRMHKGCEPKCAVMHGKVETAMMFGHMVKVKLDGGRMITVANKYKLAILKEDIIFFHRHIIAEVVLAD
jgi:hypothetical protein